MDWVFQRDLRRVLKVPFFCGTDCFGWCRCTDEEGSMIGSNAYNYINVLNSAANASYLRDQVISNNIANVDTPGFKRSDVKFEDYLKEELSGNNDTMDQAVADINLSNLKGSVYTDESELSYRLDGNNVDEDTESANLAENQIRYYALLESMTSEFSRIKSVLESK
jgi:flagellar basal-body rod protein FlgB